MTKNMHPEEESVKAKRQTPPAMNEAPKAAMPPSEFQLVSFGDRITYTFAYGKEVGSIHFDRGRGEIFYKGHNIRNMDLEEWQMQVLENLRLVLEKSEEGQRFATPYGRTLDKVIWEKSH